MRAAFLPTGYLPAYNRFQPQAYGTPSPARQSTGKDQVTFSGIRSRDLMMSNDSEAILNSYKGKAAIVNWNAWTVASHDIPLATLGLETCRALILVDRDKTFLAHVLDNASAEDIHAALLNARQRYGLNLATSEIAVVRGSVDNEEVESNIHEALQMLGRGRSDDIHYYHRDQDSEHPVGVAVVGGEILLCRKPKPIRAGIDEHEISA